RCIRRSVGEATDRATRTRADSARIGAHAWQPDPRRPTARALTSRPPVQDSRLRSRRLTKRAISLFAIRLRSGDASRPSWMGQLDCRAAERANTRVSRPEANVAFDAR